MCLTTWDHFWVSLSWMLCVHSYAKYDILMLKLEPIYYTSVGCDLIYLFGKM